MVNPINNLIDRVCNLVFMALRRGRLAFLKDATVHEKIFTPKYGIRRLKDPEHGSYSGPGSTVERTKAIRAALPELLTDLGCDSMVDAPCGDFRWMQEIELPLEKYIGVDVVRELISSNNDRYANAQREFRHHDIVEQVLPKVDLVLNRDVLIHLSFADIFRFIELLKSSGSTYLLTTHFPKQSENTDISTGAWRPLNLEIAPFNFPSPIRIISECYAANPDHADKSLALWKIEELP